MMPRMTSNGQSFAAGVGRVLGIASPWSNSETLERITVESFYPGMTRDQLDELLPLDRARALRVPALVRARNLIVSGLSNGHLVTGAAAPWLESMDPARPNVNTLATVWDDMFFYGRAWFLVLGRDLDTLPTGLRAIEQARIDFDDNGRPVGIDGDRLRDPGDLIMVEHTHPGILHPSLGLTIRRGETIGRAAARASENPVPSIDLHQTEGQTLDDDSITKLIKGWREARRGENGGVAYSSPTIEPRAMGQAPEQLLIDGRNASALDVARITNLPAWGVDASVSGSSMTYSNVPSRSRELVDYTLKSYIAPLVGRLGMPDVVRRGTTVRMDLTSLLQGSFAERMTAGKTAIDAGIYSPEEVRSMDTDTHMRASDA